MKEGDGIPMLQGSGHRLFLDKELPMPESYESDQMNSYVDKKEIRNHDASCAEIMRCMKIILRSSGKTEAIQDCDNLSPERHGLYFRQQPEKRHSSIHAPIHRKATDHKKNRLY